MVMYDELVHFTESQFFYMLSRNRSTCGVKPYIRATCNPDGESWVAKFIDWWIDPETGYADESRCGKIRYFVRKNNIIHWADTPQELYETFGLYTPEDKTDVKSVSFMSVETQIARIRGNIASAYAQAAQKGAQLPAVQNSENLPGTIMGIPAGGLPDDVYTITVESSDQAGGSASGGGVLSRGMAVTVTVEAVAVDGYHFVNWQENGQTVSESESYTFTVTGDRTLTAVFEESLYVSGVDWWAASLPSSGGWEKVTCGNGKFVTVNDKGKAAYSTDGISWTEVALPSSADWDGVAYGNGKFVAVANRSNKAAYSTDGITWTAATMPSSAGWYCVAYGNGKFVAIASGSASKIAAYSTDGITWTAVTLPSTTNWQSVTYGNGKFVAVGQGKAAYSTDGISWTDVTLPFKTWRSVAYGDGKFVTIPGESVEALYSTDGVTWAAATLPSAIYWQNVTYGGGKFVAVSTMSSNEAAYSTDGITWRAATMPSSAYWRCVTYGNGKFVAVAGSGNKAAYSSEKGPGV